MFWILLPSTPIFSTLSPDPLPSLHLEQQTLPMSSPAHFLGLLNPLPLSSPTPSNSPDFRWDLLPMYLTLSPISQRNYSLNCILPHPSNRPPSSQRLLFKRSSTPSLSKSFRSLLNLKYLAPPEPEPTPLFSLSLRPQKNLDHSSS